MAGTYIDRMATGQARRQHGKPVTFAWDCLRDMPDKAVDAAVSRDGRGDGRGDGERPQWGGGVDHPNKVQQRKAQTECDYSLLPFVTITSLLLDMEYLDRGLEYRKNRLMFIILVSYLLRKAPWVLVTLESNPDGSIFQRGGGISYPSSNI